MGVSCLRGTDSWTWPGADMLSMPRWKQRANFLLPKLLGFQEQRAPLQWMNSPSNSFSFEKHLSYFYNHLSLLSTYWMNPHSHCFISNYCSNTGILKNFKKIRQCEPSEIGPYSSCHECPVPIAGSSISKSMNQYFNYTFIWKENASFTSTLYLTCGTHSVTLTEPGFLW